MFWTIFFAMVLALIFWRLIFVIFCSLIGAVIYIVVTLFMIISAPFRK